LALHWLFAYVLLVRNTGSGCKFWRIAQDVKAGSFLCTLAKWRQGAPKLAGLAKQKPRVIQGAENIAHLN
jgi:hypothetical protein